MIDLEPTQLTEVKTILERLLPDTKVWAFGSRIQGTAQRYSDLDLVIVGSEPCDWRQIEQLKEAFSASNLPFSVDIIDWHAIDESFRNIILANYLPIQGR